MLPQSSNTRRNYFKINSTTDPNPFLLSLHREEHKYMSQQHYFAGEKALTNQTLDKTNDVKPSKMSWRVTWKSKPPLLCFVV